MRTSDILAKYTEKEDYIDYRGQSRSKMHVKAMPPQVMQDFLEDMDRETLETAPLDVLSLCKIVIKGAELSSTLKREDVATILGTVQAWRGPSARADLLVWLFEDSFLRSFVDYREFVSLLREEQPIETKRLIDHILAQAEDLHKAVQTLVGHIEHTEGIFDVLWLDHRDLVEPFAPWIFNRHFSGRIDKILLAADVVPDADILEAMPLFIGDPCMHVILEKKAQLLIDNMLNIYDRMGYEYDRINFLSVYWRNPLLFSKLSEAQCHELFNITMDSDIGTDYIVNFIYTGIMNRPQSFTPAEKLQFIKMGSKLEDKLSQCAVDTILQTMPPVYAHCLSPTSIAQYLVQD